MEMSGIIQLACRYQMVVDQDYLIRIPESGESHFLKFISHKRNKNIMNHDSVYIDGHDISRFYCFANIISDNLLNNCLAHFLLLSH